jgi:hypothetical protein
MDAAVPEKYLQRSHKPVPTLNVYSSPQNPQTTGNGMIL